MQGTRCAAALLLLLGIAVQQPVEANDTKFASIIIDDIGNNLERGKEVINFPVPVTLSILPQTTFSKELAVLAHKQHKEVMLHLPLQSIENLPESPGTLTLHMTHAQFVRQFKLDVTSVPFIKGINNHEGSLLTQHPGYMDWLMRAIATNRSLYFIDSRTTKKTVAAEIATKDGVPNMSRDVFLDDSTSFAALQYQFDRLIKIVNKRGYGIAIAHPHPRTIQFLRKHLPDLKKHGISVIPVSVLLAKKEGEQHATCTGATCAGM